MMILKDNWTKLKMRFIDLSVLFALIIYIWIVQTISSNPTSMNNTRDIQENGTFCQTSAGAGLVMSRSRLPEMILLNPVYPDPKERCQLTNSERSFLDSCRAKNSKKLTKEKKRTQSKKSSGTTNADTGESDNSRNTTCVYTTTPYPNHIQNTELLYSLVQAEAGNQDLDGCRLVADVVLNRIESDKFPNDLESVIYAPGQFSVVKNGALKKAQGNVSEKVVQAVNMELANARLNDDVLYFNNRPNGSGCWQYGGHYFK